MKATTEAKLWIAEADRYAGYYARGFGEADRLWACYCRERAAALLTLEGS